MDGWDGLGEPLRRQAAQVGMDTADQWMAISDGGNGLETFLTTYFPRVEVVILDFYHAAEYLGGDRPGVAPGRRGEIEGMDQGVGSRFEAYRRSGDNARLRTLVDESPPATVREPLAEAIRYFENQVHRMDYPRTGLAGGRSGRARLNPPASR